MRRDHLRGGRPLGTAADHRPLVCFHRPAELRAVVLRQQQHQLRLHDGSLPRAMGQRDRSGRHRTADGAAVLRGAAAECAGGHGPHPAGHSRQTAASLLEHGGSDAGLPAGAVLYQRYFHRVCLYRDLHHRLLRPAVSSRQRTRTDRLGAVHGLRAGGFRPVSDRRHLYLLHQRTSAVPSAPRNHCGALE